MKFVWQCVINRLVLVTIMPPDYHEMFQRFFNRDTRLASTYKPVFLRSLLDVGDLHDPQKSATLPGKEWLTRKDGKLHVDLNFIAIRFAKYYWDMEYSFRLRQSQDPQDANIIRLIKNAHNSDKKPPTILELSKNNMAEFRKMVIRNSIKKEVLVHLKTDMKDLYKKTSSSTITLDDDIIEFLHQHKIILRKGLTSVLAKYLEKLNRMTPQIANKIDTEQIHRPTLKPELILLMKKWQKSHCFYCEREFEKPHVDHVIPFNYVFTTDPYNCTLACPQCNCEKSDMLPDKDLFSNVLVRNGRNSEHLKTLNSAYSEDSYQRLFDACAAEYNGSKFFTPLV